MVVNCCGNGITLAYKNLWTDAKRIEIEFLFSKIRSLVILVNEFNDSRKIIIKYL